MINAPQPLEDQLTTAPQQQFSALRADVLTARYINRARANAQGRTLP
jgi:hypothetical protein